MTYYVVYSPRGFCNELSIAEFPSRAEAQDFRSDINNHVNKWAYDTDEPEHKSAVRNHKREIAIWGRTSY